MTIVLISVLHGVGSNGKTSTLKKLCEFLIKNDDQCKNDIIVKQGKNEYTCDKSAYTPPSGDISIVIKVGISVDIEINIGIGTSGDNPYNITNNFNFFKKHNCSIVFCATKSTGESINYFYEKLLPTVKKAVVLPFYKYKTSEAKKDKFNEQLAQRILLVTKLQCNNLNENNSQIKF